LESQREGRRPAVLNPRRILGQSAVVSIAGDVDYGRTCKNDRESPSLESAGKEFS